MAMVPEGIGSTIAAHMAPAPTSAVLLLLPASGLIPASLFACLGIFALLTALFTFFASRGMPGFARPLRLWSAAMLCTGLAALFILMREWMPPAVVYASSHLSAFISAVMLGAAAGALEGGSARRALHGAWLALLVVAVLLVAQRLRAPYVVLAGIGALGLGLVYANAARVFLPQLRQRPRALPEIWVFAALCLIALAFLLRAAWFAIGWPQAQTPLAAGYPLVVASLVFSASATLAFLAMLHERQRLALLQSYQRDSLTGLYTRGVFFEKAQAALQQAEDGVDFAVLMVDLDHFKRINDTHGHMVGDKVIAHAARVLHGSTRLSDLAGRYGGEEFCLLLQGCDAERARAFVRRLLRSASKPVDLRDGRTVPFSFSVGFVAFRRGSTAPVLEALLDQADRALLHAKERGRNRAVEVLDPAGAMEVISASAV